MISQYYLKQFLSAVYFHNEIFCFKITISLLIASLTKSSKIPFFYNTPYKHSSYYPRFKFNASCSFSDSHKKEMSISYSLYTDWTEMTLITEQIHVVLTFVSRLISHWSSCLFKHFWQILNLIVHFRVNFKVQ